MTPPLAIWKRIVVAGQLVTFPIWYLPFCFYVGFRETVGEIKSMFRDGFRAIRGRPF